jgi:hypothetical protein
MTAISPAPFPGKGVTAVRFAPRVTRSQLGAARRWLISA